MKNLKKVLALVLVVAMMMGFATVAGAADFTDAADVSHDEAVEVMTGIGVINGYPDGSFRPEGNVTRAQMAKMIAYIVSGGEDVGDLYAGANSFSDCLTHWARGYIAYANQTGIVAGVGGGLFNPDGNVTGAQAAKMLLCTLGYDQAVESYTGTGWAVNVMDDARDAGLLDGLDAVNMYNALSREDAAQMMFNALQATMVDYESKGTSIDLPGIGTIITGASDPKPVPQGTTYDNNLGTDNLQLAERYFTDLVKDMTTGTDDFGRPGTTWVFDGSTIGTYTSDDPVVTYTSVVKEKDIFSDLGVTGIAGSSARYVVMDKIYSDGLPVAQSKETAEDSGQYEADSSFGDDGFDESVIIAKGDNTNTHGTGNGVTVEIYKTDVTNHYIMVTYREYLAKVSSITKADEDKGEGRKINLSADVSGAFSGTLSYETDEFERNDLVLVTIASGEVKSVKAPEVLEDVAVTAYTSNSVTVNGTKYNFSQVNKIEDAGNFKMGSGNSYTFYLDSCGNVIKGETYTATNDEYVYVTAVSIEEQGDATVETAYKNVRYVDATGTSHIAKTAASEAPTTGNWYAIDDDSDNEGYKEFSAPTGGDTRKTASGVTKITKGQPQIGTGIVANSETMFVLRTSQTEQEFSAYTGISALPTYTWEGGGNTAVAVIGDDGYAKVVFMNVYNGTGGTSSEDVIYLMEKTGTAYDEANEKSYDVYDAVVDGELTTVSVKAGASVTENALVKITKYTSEGYIETVSGTLGDAYSSKITLTNDKITFSDPTLTIDNSAYLTTADTVVYMIDGDDDLTVGIPEDLVSDDVTGNAYVEFASGTDKTVVAIYFDGTIN